ncbi:MAG: hypothetical protein LZ166_05615 [Thaumarchaeota archaeon]|jgi:hypothetical protein|nr:hypothetical protein [Candidatus Wolframiiraptor allenii]
MRKVCRACPALFYYYLAYPLADTFNSYFRLYSILWVCKNLEKRIEGEKLEKDLA